MKVLNINKNVEAKLAIIIPENMENNLAGLLNNYLQHLGDDLKSKTIFISVYAPSKGVLKNDIFNEEWDKVQEVLTTKGITNLAIVPPIYYQKICKLKKKPVIEKLVGRVDKIHLKDEVKDIDITFLLNYFMVNMFPEKKKLLNKTIDTIKLMVKNEYVNEADEFIESLKIDLITDIHEAHKKFKSIIDEEFIAVDIEATGLLWYKDELLTISFSTSNKEGFSIPLHKVFVKNNEQFLSLLKKFFEKYNGRTIFHNGMFDVAYLVYRLWMNSITDTENMIKGVNHFNIDDTMIMAYLCLNSYTRPSLGLKDLAYVKYGNWDKDIDQSKLIEYTFEEVGRYNTIDTMATYYIFEEYYTRLKEEKQDKLYEEYYRQFLPALIKTKMNGITIDKSKLDDMEHKLSKSYDDNLYLLNDTDIVQEAFRIIKEKEEAKGKSKLMLDRLKFNPKSTNHLRVVLFDVLGLKPLKFSSKTNEPSTDKETLETLEKEHPEYNYILKPILEISQMKTVHSTFVKSFQEQIVQDKKGNWKLFPNFNITGTVSGRMTGSKPNLLNLPSGSKFGKLVKEYIIGSDDKIIAQIDESALEDRLITSVSGCKNKFRIFDEGIDAHSLNAYGYFKDELKSRGIEINPNEAESINSIAKLAKDLRQDGKAYTFKMAYGGITEFLEAYTKTYQEIFEYKDYVEKFLLKNGFITGFYGLKCRGDLSSIKDETQYQSVLRSLFNMTIQSGALIVTKAIFLIQQWIEEKGYVNDIKVTNSVYDSIYFEVKPNAKIIKDLNEKIVELLTPIYKDIMPYFKDEKYYLPLEADLELGVSWVAKVLIENNLDEKGVEKKLEDLYIILKNEKIIDIFNDNKDIIERIINKPIKSMKFNILDLTKGKYISDDEEYEFNIFEILDIPIKILELPDGIAEIEIKEKLKEMEK